jgi:hypothetical protein
VHVTQTLQNVIRSISTVSAEYRNLRKEEELSATSGKKIAASMRELTAANGDYRRTLAHVVKGLNGADLNKLFDTISKGGKEGKAALDVLTEALGKT